MRQGRPELLGDISRLASSLNDLATAAGDRFQEPEPHEPKEEIADAAAGDEGEPRLPSNGTRDELPTDEVEPRPDDISRTEMLDAVSSQPDA